MAGVDQTPSTSDALTKPAAPAAMMKRESTYAATLDQLDLAKQEEKPAGKVAVPKSTGLSAADLLLASLIVPLSSALVLGYTTDGCDAAPTNWHCASVPPNWAVIVACLVMTAGMLLGVGNVVQMGKAAVRPSEGSGSGMRVPLTDAVVDIKTLNKFANSAQCREKSLKILQYILKLGAYVAVFPKPVASTLKSLSKSTSIARRFFKFCRWIKHFEDAKEAKEEKNTVMRTLLYLRVCANLGADWAEDVCSLERIGFLPKGTLSVEFMLFAEYCQLVLALTEIFISTVMVRKQQEVCGILEAAREETKAPSKDAVKAERKLGLMRLELVKFISDVGKAIFDCELAFSHEGVFIGCSLFSALVSTHKNMVKVLK